jgi:hypothetical protein
MNPEHLTARHAAFVIGVPLDDWKGNCFAIATQIVEKGLVEGRAVYGHWLGPVAKDSFFAHRRKLPFIQHGWILLKDGRILDPTRWVFEATKPYLYVGEDDEDYYDEGGDRLRTAMTQARPVPKWKPDGQMGPKLKLTAKETAFVRSLLGDGAGPVGKPLTREQLFWLANAPYALLGEHAKAIFLAIKGARLGALIPIDNLLRAEAER